MGVERGGWWWRGAYGGENGPGGRIYGRYHWGREVLDDRMSRGYMSAIRRTSVTRGVARSAEIRCATTAYVKKFFKTTVGSMVKPGEQRSEGAEVKEPSPTAFNHAKKCISIRYLTFERRLLRYLCTNLSNYKNTRPFPVRNAIPSPRCKKTESNRDWKV